MFTGIAEETGTIRQLRDTGGGRILTVKAEKVLEGTKEGDSICVDGVCLTATTLGNDFFTADVSEETLRYTVLGSLNPGDLVNLERALSVGSRLGGHIVAGHVDGTCTVSRIEHDGDSYLYTFLCDDSLMKFIIKKGSVTVNGISLTVAETGENTFSIEVIPHTLQVTNLGQLKAGDTVNIENDMIGKYVEHFISQKNESHGLTMEMLENLI
ncbi:MAG: riboflavin synthase [bacterium LCO1.1]|uniref:Riboflavin synthase n=1 Tax=Candidatus Weimeria bifida TaxID=2599074 RepID=A0A6N7IYV2_9FIRM|nr:riboflavin synthase [Candidatus Weimeria bifida]